MNSRPEDFRPAIADRAADWFVVNRAGPLSAADRAAFVAWLQASPIHVEEYLGIALIARDLPTAVDDPDVSLDSLVAQARADGLDNIVHIDQPTVVNAPRATGIRVSPNGLLAIAAAVVVVVASIVWFVLDNTRLRAERFQTARGQQSTWHLSDGSVVYLNADTTVTVRYTPAERFVVLDKGQALFEVAHDSGRGFRVVAGGADVVAVGTQFDVYRMHQTIVVTVVEGSVAVIAGGLRPLTAGATLPPQAVRVSANQRVRIDAGVVSTRPAPIDAHMAVAWVRQQIAFEQRPLGEVADEFNRYVAVPFQIDDPALRALRVSGVFNTYDADSFAAFVQTLDGVVVQKLARQIRVTRSPSIKRAPPPPVR